MTSGAARRCAVSGDLPRRGTTSGGGPAGHVASAGACVRCACCRSGLRPGPCARSLPCARSWSTRWPLPRPMPGRSSLASSLAGGASCASAGSTTTSPAPVSPTWWRSRGRTSPSYVPSCQSCSSGQRRRRGCASPRSRALGGHMSCSVVCLPLPCAPGSCPSPLVVPRLREGAVMPSLPWASRVSCSAFSSRGRRASWALSSRFPACAASVPLGAMRGMRSNPCCRTRASAESGCAPGASWTGVMTRSA